LQLARLRDSRHDVSCHHSRDGINWTPFGKSTAVAYARNISLYAAGEGEVCFHDLSYRGLK
jgi:hypothetical protein